MPPCHWIICERTNRWASALRLALDRAAAGGGACYRLREVRSLHEIASELARRPESLVALEVHDRNLSNVLAWLAAAEQQFPQARCLALVDRSLSAGGPSVRSHSRESVTDVCDALREAGAMDVAESPRRLASALELGRRHAAANVAHDTVPAEERSFVEQLWATLPWQEG
jgi:hypothetical protein